MISSDNNTTNIRKSRNDKQSSLHNRGSKRLDRLNQYNDDYGYSNQTYSEFATGKNETTMYALEVTPQNID